MHASLIRDAGEFTAAMHRLSGSGHYDPAQPRAPAGTTIGGRWIASGQTAPAAGRKPNPDLQPAFDLDAPPEAVDVGLDEPGMREAESVRQTMLAAVDNFAPRLAEVRAAIKVQNDIAMRTGNQIAELPMGTDPDSPAWATPEAQWQAAIKESGRLYRLESRIKKQQAAAALKVISPENPAQLELLIDPKGKDYYGPDMQKRIQESQATWKLLPKEQQLKIRTGMQTVNRMIDKAASRSIFDVLMLAPADPALGYGDRAYYDAWAIHVTKATGASTIVHEAGHHIENNTYTQGQRLNDRALAFLNRRTAGDTEKPLAELRPGWGFRPDEMAKADKFVDPYVGKTYKGRVTEVISMGLERMAQDPVDFARRDPDHWRMIYTVMKGTWWERT
jgi:hypothetical protein